MQANALTRVACLGRAPGSPLRYPKIFAKLVAVSCVLRVEPPGGCFASPQHHVPARGVGLQPASGICRRRCRAGYRRHSGTQALDQGRYPVGARPLGRIVRGPAAPVRGAEGVHRAVAGRGAGRADGDGHGAASPGQADRHYRKDPEDRRVRAPRRDEVSAQRHRTDCHAVQRRR